MEYIYLVHIIIICDACRQACIIIINKKFVVLNQNLDLKEPLMLYYRGIRTTLPKTPEESEGHGFLPIVAIEIAVTMGIQGSHS